MTWRTAVFADVLIKIFDPGPSHPTRLGDRQGDQSYIAESISHQRHRESLIPLIDHL